jgi:hypothetical protein
VDATKLDLTEIDHDPKTEKGMRRNERQSGGKGRKMEPSHTSFLSGFQFLFLVSLETEFAEIFVLLRIEDYRRRQIAK